MIYFAQATPDSPIKVGTTVRLAERLEHHYRELGYRINVLGIMDGGVPEEQAVHARFDHLRLEPTRRCEWFRPGPDLLAYIQMFARPWQPSDDEPPKKVQKNAGAILLRSGPAWKAWFDRLAASQGLAVNQALEMAVRHWAGSLNYPEPMPERVRPRFGRTTDPPLPTP